MDQAWVEATFDGIARFGKGERGFNRLVFTEADWAACDYDTTYPTICGTGTEDYFCGSYNFEKQETHRYQEVTTPYSGLSQVIRPDGLYESQQRFSLYRWHIMDPIRFEKDLRVTIQALGCRSGGRYLPLQDDIASVAYWYQTEPHALLPVLPEKDKLEIN